MDVVTFAEKFYGVELKEWQKTYLRTLDRLYTEGDVRVVVVPKGVGRMFTYFKLKELISNGSTNDSKY
jgi:hypothetical protein